MVVICSFSCERSSFSLKAVCPRNSITLVCCAFFSCCFLIARSALSFSSGFGTFTAVWPDAFPIQSAAQRTMRSMRLISFESDQVLHHAAKISAHFQIADEKKLLVELESGGRGLLAGARIDVTDVDLQLIKDGVALGRIALLEDLPVKLLNEKHRGAAREDVVIADEFLTRHAGGQKRDDLLLRQRRFAREHGLGRKRSAIDINVDRVIADE